MPNTPWDKVTERRKKATDHDNLIILLGIVDSLVKSFDAHIEEDKKNFKILFRAYYITLGIFLAVNGLPALATTLKILSGGVK